MIQFYLLTIVSAIVAFGISFYLLKKRKKLLGFLFPILYLGQQIFLFFRSKNMGKDSLGNNSVTSIDMTKILNQDLILGISLFIIMVIALVLLNKKFSRN